MASITIVLSTYNRPSALKQTVRSVLGQSLADWRLLIVGDRCSPATGRMLKKFKDPRIAYVNFEQRCGEQSLPNSVGLLSANTPYVAFLNQDDLWLPDHLERGLRSLRESKAEMLTCGTAFIGRHPKRHLDYAVIERSPPNRSIADAFHSAPFMFEPISARIVDREAALRVGPFKHSSTLYRVPLVDWLNRAARLGLRHIDDPTLSVLKDNFQLRVFQRGLSYRAPILMQRMAMRRLKRFGCEGFRQQLEDSNQQMVSLGNHGRDPYGPPKLPPGAHEEWGPVLTAAMRDLFLATGEDPYETTRAALSHPRGRLLSNALAKRTGEAMPKPPALDDLLAQAQQQLERAGSW